MIALCGSLLLMACRPSDGDSTDLRDPTPYEVVDAAYGVAGRAVIVVMDGARLEETFGEGESDAAGVPTSDILPRINESLRPLGGVAAPAYVTGTPFTSSSHANLLTGVRQYYANMGASDGYGLRQSDYPTIFEELRQQRDLPAEHAVLVANTEILGDLTHSHAPGFGSAQGGTYRHMTEAADSTTNARTDAPVLTGVLQSLESQGAVFALANLHQIDRSGHGNPEVYANFVADVDGPIVSLWRQLREGQRHGAELPLVVILSDHGRHRFIDYEDPWQDHGCSCSGCREVPLLVLGPGIESGTVATQPYLLEDVTHTVAWLMGVSMPYSTGLPLDEFLAGSPEVPARSGEVALAADGDLVAWQEWQPSHSARSSVVVDGETLSSGVLHVEQPSVLRSDIGDFACWRQLDLVAGAEDWPWEARCSRRDGAGDWDDLGLETLELPDGFNALLEVDDKDRLWVMYLAGESDGGLDAITPSTVGYHLARWDAMTHVWEYASWLRGVGTFPSHARWHMDGEQAWVAWVESDDEPTMRYTRHITLSKLHWKRGEEPTWTSLHSLYAEASDNSDLGRLERPVLGLAGEELVVAAVGYSSGGTFLMAATQDAGSGEGGEWSELVTLDDTGLVFPHLSPAFSDDGWLYWARQSGSGGVEICRADGAQATPSCRDSGYGWIDTLAPAAGGTWASLSDGDLSWKKVWVPF